MQGSQDRFGRGIRDLLPGNVQGLHEAARMGPFLGRLGLWRLLQGDCLHPLGAVRPSLFDAFADL